MINVIGEKYRRLDMTLTRRDMNLFFDRLAEQDDNVASSLNQINLNNVILEKDKNASVKYHHERNLEQFLLER